MEKFCMNQPTVSKAMESAVPKYLTLHAPWVDITYIKIMNYKVLRENKFRFTLMKS